MIEEARRGMKEKLNKDNVFNKKAKGHMLLALNVIQKSILGYCIP